MMTVYPTVVKFSIQKSRVNGHVCRVSAASALGAVVTYSIESSMQELSTTTNTTNGGGSSLPKPSPKCSTKLNFFCRCIFVTTTLIVLQLTFFWRSGKVVVRNITTGGILETVQNQAYNHAPRVNKTLVSHNTTHGNVKILQRIPQQMDDCFRNYNLFSFPLEKNGCHVNAGGRPHCKFQNLRLNPSLIKSENRGGEPLESVMGQAGKAEFLSYEPGAFTVSPSALQQVPSEMGKHFHYLKDVLKSFQAYNKNDHSAACTHIWKGTTLFLTRYEYVNVYHTMTDWWNTFFSIPVDPSGVLNLPINIVFLDSHPQGNLDVVWNDLLGGTVTYARHFNTTICFEMARFVPPGYASPLFPLNGNDKCASEIQGTDFRNFFFSAYNELQHVKRIPGHIVVIDRVPYLAHARSNTSKTLRAISNLREMALTLPRQFASSKYNNNVTVKVVTLVHDKMQEQICAIRQADILIANHGAGMTHELFMDDGSYVIELTCDHHFFVWLAKWRGPGIRHYCRGHVVQEKISPEYWQKNVVDIIDGIFAAREKPKNNLS